MKNKHLLFAFLIGAASIGLTNCKVEPQNNNEIKIVNPKVETESVKSMFGEDAADDPAIYLHPDGADKSWVIGTNKKAGLCIYSLQGKEIYFTPVGLVNNVDLCYEFPMSDGSTIDVLAASNRSNNSITVMKINTESTSLDTILSRDLISSVDEVYGCCLYKDSKENKFYVLINGKDGTVEQWHLFSTQDNLIDGEMVFTYQVETQPEGMVVDPYYNALYVGEEDRGIWRFELLSDEAPVFLEHSDSTNINIAYDIEGLTMFASKNEGEGYLIASSQGNFTYAIFERELPNEYIGSFKIEGINDMDGTEDTDGIDVVNASINSNFKQGLFVAQDGMNFIGDSLHTQNFKLVAWEDIASKFNPQLLLE